MERLEPSSCFGSPDAVLLRFEETFPFRRVSRLTSFRHSRKEKATGSSGWISVAAGGSSSLFPLPSAIAHQADGSDAESFADSRPSARPFLYAPVIA